MSWASSLGFSIYEKLSNIVLLLPLSLVLVCRERRHVNHWRASLAGGLLGGLPLLYVNYRYFWRTGELLSTRQVAAQSVMTLASLAHFLRDYVALGDGSLVRQFILGQNHGFAVVEGLVPECSPGSSSLPVEGCCGEPDIDDRRGLLPGGGNGLVPVAECHLGAPLGDRHAFPVSRHRDGVSASGRRLIRPSVLALATGQSWISAFGVLMIVRAQGAVDLTCSLARGDSSEIWDPSLTRLGDLCAKRAGQTVPRR